MLTPIHYTINPTLQVLLFVCKGELNSPELFEVSELARRDDRFSHVEIVLIALFAAWDNFEMNDAREAIQRVNYTALQEYTRARIVLPSLNPEIDILVKAMQLLPSNVHLNIKVCLSIVEAIDWLGLSGVSDEMIQFWEESHAL